MNYGTYNRECVKDVAVQNPVGLILSSTLTKRVKRNEKTSELYREWVGFLKKKTLLDEYMLYTSFLAFQPVEFDSDYVIKSFCKEYSKFRLVLKKDKIYVNWLELFDEFVNTRKHRKVNMWKAFMKKFF